MKPALICKVSPMITISEVADAKKAARSSSGTALPIASIMAKCDAFDAKDASGSVCCKI